MAWWCAQQEMCTAKTRRLFVRCFNGEECANVFCSTPVVAVCAHVRRISMMSLILITWRHCHSCLLDPLSPPVVNPISYSFTSAQVLPCLGQDWICSSASPNIIKTSGARLCLRTARGPLGSSLPSMGSAGSRPRPPRSRVCTVVASACPRYPLRRITWCVFCSHGLVLNWRVSEWCWEWGRLCGVAVIRSGHAEGDAWKTVLCMKHFSSSVRSATLSCMVFWGPQQNSMMIVCYDAGHLPSGEHAAFRHQWLHSDVHSADRIRRGAQPIWPHDRYGQDAAACSLRASQLRSAHTWLAIMALYRKILCIMSMSMSAGNSMKPWAGCGVHIVAWSNVGQACEMTDSLAYSLQGCQARSCPAPAQRRPSRARPPGLRAPERSSSSSSRRRLLSSRSLLSPPLPLKR